MPRDVIRTVDAAAAGGGRRLLLTWAVLLLQGIVQTVACSTSSARFPWAVAGKPGPATSFAHAEVTTVNSGYVRGRSQVLVRRVKRPTRANLDYAAYHANFMNADPAPEGMNSEAGKRPDASHPFGGALDPSTLTGSLAATPLTADERSRPLAVVPMVEWLTSKHAPAADRLEDVASKVRSESWGLGGGPQAVRQIATELYLHVGVRAGGAAGSVPELWLKVEFAPWFTAFGTLPDDDGDGFGAVYGRIPAEAIGADTAALVNLIRDDYAGHVLSAAEVTGWAHQLASYWYPSYNTDLVGGGADGHWPDDQTEPEVVRELGGQRFDGPTVVMRGKPQGKPVYNVFLVDGASASAAGNAGAGAPPASTALTLARSQPSPAPGGVGAAIRAELHEHGGSWARWSDEVAPVHDLFHRTLAAIPTGIKATAGNDGFLFFRQSLGYVVAGDLEKQRRGKNPIPVIVSWKKLLADHGVDFLFVPVPTKEEIFPDKLGRTPADQALAAPFVGKVVNPFERKLLADLADKGVETIDLLPAFLRERAAAGAKPPLFQAQDTHWTSRGIELAAQQIAARVRQYPWYGELSRHRKKFTFRDAPFSRHGDLHSRLPESGKAGYPPENLVGRQVLGADGTLYDDDPESPVVVLGDSFTGVFELMDCEHAGISAHIAAEIGYPTDLVMSYGGGPNVRQKLLRRGAQALGRKKLVIWMMTARDLYDFWEGWQPATAR